MCSASARAPLRCSQMPWTDRAAARVSLTCVAFINAQSSQPACCRGAPPGRGRKQTGVGTQKTATRLHARLLQEPERCRDSQRAPCPGVLGCWFLAGVYHGIDQLSGWIWLAFCPEPFLHPPQSIPDAGGDPRSISGCWGREAGRGCTWSAQPGQRLRAPCRGRNARQRKELRGRQKLPLLLV